MPRDYDSILKELAAFARPGAAENAAQIGITPRTRFYGVPVAHLRKMAREIGRNHLLAQALWLSNIHDARILASMIADPAMITEAQMDRWAEDFDSWDLCDQCCANLFRKTDFAYAKAKTWSGRDQPLVRRAAFALIATLAHHDRWADDQRFARFIPLIQRAASDPREPVRNGAAWALRQIGKRSPTLRRAAISAAETLSEDASEAARWVAENVLEDLGRR